MSRWNEWFQSHAVHSSIEQLDIWLSEREDNYDDGASAEVRRARKVIELFKSSLANVDPEITPANLLDNLTSQLRERYLVQYMSGFANTGALSDIQSANEQLTPVLQSLTWLLPYSKKSAVRNHARVLERTFDQSITNIEAKKQDIAESLQTLETKAHELATLQNRLESSIETRRLELEQQVSMWQQQFSESQEKRLETFNSWKERIEQDLKNKNDALLDNTKNELLTFESDAEQKLNSIIEDSEAKHQAIIELYQLSAGDSKSGGYAKSAGDEDDAANKWRWISVGFIATTVAWLIFAYCQMVGLIAADAISQSVVNEVKQYQVEPFSWQRFLVSISLTGVLLVGAGYASQQSNRHREEAKAARTFALQIKALDPFIHSLEPDAQAELKKSLTPIFFAGYESRDKKDTAVTEKGVSIISTAICDVIKAARGN